MNTRLFSQAMGEVGDRYYEEAADYVCRRKRHGWVQWSAMAAGLVLLFTAAFSLLSRDLNPQGAPLPDSTPETPEIHISMDSIFLNDIAEPLDAARRWYDPQLYDDITWGREEVAGYYGGDLTPAYLPDGLTAAASNGTAAVIAGKDGHLAEDTVWYQFYHDYYEDGSPKLTEEVAACKGFYMAVSKVGLLKDCIYILPENEVKTSDLGGTAVTFGYRSMPYGPYDPKTHEPSGHYDLYVAEFKLNGVEYQFVAEQMKVEELVKVVSSVIYGREVTVDG